MEIKNLVREGIVSVVNVERCSARVAFEDRDGLVSAELPVLQSACSGNRFFSLPDVGDKVVCLMVPNAHDGTGFILGARYHDKNPPPSTNPDTTMIKFADGATISFNRKTHALTITCAGDIKINGKNIYLN